MPRTTTPFLEVKATRTGEWLRLPTTLYNPEQAIKVGDLVAADLDDTGTWPRWFEVRVMQAGKVIEHWTVREKGPMLQPMSAANVNYVASLLDRAGTSHLPAPIHKEPAPRKAKLPKPPVAAPPDDKDLTL